MLYAIPVTNDDGSVAMTLHAHENDLDAFRAHWEEAGMIVGTPVADPRLTASLADALDSQYA